MPACDDRLAAMPRKRGPPALDEARAIALLERALGRSARSPRVEVGIGDDAAVLTPGTDKLVFTVDASVEHVHFERRWLSLADVGWRSLMAAASDLAAMGARPLCALSNLGTPRAVAASELSRIGRGQAAAAAAIGCPVVGGNISRGDVLSITTAVLGESSRPLLRSGARPGDELWLIGELGLAAAGLRLLRFRRGRRARGGPTGRRALERCVLAWRRPVALIDAGLELGRRAHAAIDVSDGLGSDARHIAASSKVKVVVEAEQLRRAMAPELGIAAAELDCDPLALMLQGGEDYALLCAGPARQRPRRARRIGRIERGRGAWLETERGLAPLGSGFDHLHAGE
jgi:thiamine-monophosphate kinase